MSYYARLPRALRDELARVPRGAQGTRAVPLTEPERELLAKAALELGVTPKGPVLVYVVRRLKAGLGLGDFPTPPNLGPGEGAFIDARLADAGPALERAIAEQRNADNPPAPRLHVDPTGYTSTEDVGHPPDVADLADARRRRQGPEPRIA